MRVVLLFGEWVRAGCSELSSGLVALACSARNPMDGVRNPMNEPARTRPSPSGRRLGEPARDTARSRLAPFPAPNPQAPQRVPERGSHTGPYRGRVSVWRGCGCLRPGPRARVGQGRPVEAGEHPPHAPRTGLEGTPLSPTAPPPAGHYMRCAYATRHTPAYYGVPLDTKPPRNSYLAYARRVDIFQINGHLAEGAAPPTR